MSVINSRLRFASKSYSEWEAKNPILLKGELSYDSTNERFKIGNGESNWLDLEYCDESLIDRLNELNIKLEIGTDWNQNNETAVDYVKNRTHWIEQGAEVILKSDYKFYGEQGDGNIPLEIGEKYIITIDNIKYEAIAFDYGYTPEPTNYSRRALGNSNLLDNEYSESNLVDLPFLIVVYTTESGFNEWAITYSDNYDNHHIEIAKETEIIYHPLDEKFIPDTFATNEYVDSLYQRLSSDKALRFYCVEDVAVVVNGVSTVYPANSNIEVKFAEGDVFEIIPTSDNSILVLNGFPGALGTYYSWLEGVKQFSNILFDMNAEDMYTKWNQGNQGAYQVQYAQYSNCIFWSDNPYINDVAVRTNYTLYNTAQLPLCYSSIPDNTFKAFYLALGVINDPNWSNPAYKESFAKATWATQVFSYYGARVIGTPEHFSITLPKDCRGLMFYARNTEAAGTFNAANVTNFGAKSGSWREAFGYCSSLRRLYIENLKVSLNISWSPVDYESISYIISNAANTSAITISVSPYTYNLLSQSDFELAISKNITIELIIGNYIEDKRLNAIENKADIEHNHDNVYYTEVEIDTKLLEINTSISDMENGATVIKKAEQASNADKATSADIALFAEKDAKGNIIDSTYATKEDLEQKAPLVHEHNDLYYTELEIDTKLASQQDYADNAATEVKDELLNGAGEAYDTLKELGLLIDENKDAIEALETIATNKADKVHTHSMAEITDLAAALSVKANKEDLDDLKDFIGTTPISEQIDNKIINKKDKDFIVIITANAIDGEMVYSANKTLTEINDAYGQGKTVYALYNNYICPLIKIDNANCQFVLNKGDIHDIFLLTSSSVVYSSFNATTEINKKADKTYVDNTFALKSDIPNVDLSNYYSKEEIDNMELITVADIDAICGATIMIADEETRF